MAEDEKKASIASIEDIVNEYLEQQENKISELEKKTELILTENKITTTYINRAEMIVKAYQKVWDNHYKVHRKGKKELSELRAMQETIVDSDPTRMENDIKKLKERVEGIHKSIHGIENGGGKAVASSLVETEEGERDASTNSTPSKCEFYNKDYCIPCKSPEKFYECEMVKIGNQIKIDKWQPKELISPKCDICGIEVIDPIYNLLYLGKKRVCPECFYKEKPKEPTPSKCEFCGRDLILYKNQWICGHGCMKLAVKPKEPPEQGDEKE